MSETVKEAAPLPVRSNAGLGMNETYRLMIFLTSRPDVLTAMDFNSMRIEDGLLICTFEEKPTSFRLDELEKIIIQPLVNRQRIDTEQDVVKAGSKQS